MQTIPFGKTGHSSTRLLFGAAALANVTQYDADKTMDLLSERGINHIDTAASYGKSEELLGPWIKHHRKEIFLATKTEQRTKEESLEQLYRSMDLMKTDHIDLWQMHFLVDEKEWKTAFNEGGSLEALVEARDKGLVDYLGVTGHELVVPHMHLRSLEQFPFDSVLLPYNYALMKNSIYRAAFYKLYHLCRERNIAFQCIKTNCRGPWGDIEPNRATWYQPFEEAADIQTAIGWAMQLEGAFINTAGDINLLPHVLDAGEAFDPKKSYDEEMDRLASERNMQSLFV